jgi:Kef-type K+ transport system membrane component KefB
MGGLQVVLSTVVLGGAAMLFGHGWNEALALGMILTLSSTAIVLQAYAEKGWMTQSGGQSGFSILLFQDIAVIPMLAVLPLLALSGSGGADAAGGGGGGLVSNPALNAILVLLCLAGVVVAGKFLVRYVFRFIAASDIREIFTAAALLLVIGVAILMERIGLSAALGAFLAGVVLADSEYRHELESDIEPFKGLLLGLFFIAVGAAINFQLIVENPLLVIGWVAAIVVAKGAVLFAIGKIFRLGTDQNLMVTFSLAQGGEFAFVLFSLAGQNRVLSSETIGILIAAVALSMAATPFMILFYDRILRPRLGTKEKPEREPDQLEEQSRVLIAGFGRYGHLIGRLLRS